MPLPKFSFVPEKQIGKDIDESYHVSILRNNVLFFPAEIVRVYDLGGKYIKLFADIEKKSIGWSICEGKTDLDTLNTARLMVVRKSGQVVLGISKILKKFDMLKTYHPYLEVKKYKSLLDDNDIWYITLTKEIK